jgi:hypothetical protein
MLNRTFDNPDKMEKPTGFTNETQRIDMLMFKDILFNTNYRKAIRNTMYYLIVIWGLLASIGFLTDSQGLKNTTALVSSPMPLVFSGYNGVETFSTSFWLDINNENNYTILDKSVYARLGGSYNKRNVYGAMFSHGPLFDNQNLIALRQDILYYAICIPGDIVKEMGIYGGIDGASVLIKSNTIGDSRVWYMNIECD